MANKITIIGAGQVGSSIAYALCLKSIATEIVMIDIDKNRAMGEALDIRQGTPYMSPVNIHDGSYEDAKDSDLVILTSGVARKPGQSRLDLAQTNVNITKSIIPQIAKVAPNAIYIIVANPVDILTYQFVKTSGIPDVYGIGQPNLHAYVFGEHGDSSFVPWSLVNIASVPVDSYYDSLNGKGKAKPDHAEIEDFVRKSGGIIISAKKCTNYGIGATTARLCEIIKNSNDSVTIASSMLTGEYGISDVCLSILTVVGGHGITGRLVAPLTDNEIAQLKHSADCLKDVIKQLEF